MDGIHDLGGKYGFGAIAFDEDAQAFTEHWQGAVFTMVNTLNSEGVVRNTDHFRHAVERIDPICYLSDGYYGRWLGAIETLLVEAGQLTEAELNQRAQALGARAQARIAARPKPLPDVFEAAPSMDEEQVANTAARTVEEAPKFHVGQQVRTIATPVSAHTRLPAYARSAPGTIVAHHGAWVFPDSNAHGNGEQPRHLYTVIFRGDVLWSSAGDADIEVCLDLFEPYLSGETPGGKRP